MKTNQNTTKLIEELKKHSTSENSKFWKRIAKELEKPTRNKREVNIKKINENIKEGEIVIVPGKILSAGELTHKITIASFSQTEAAKEKLKNNLTTIHDLLKKDPKGKNIRIIG